MHSPGAGPGSSSQGEHRHLAGTQVSNALLEDGEEGGGDRHPSPPVCSPSPFLAWVVPIPFSPLGPPRPGPWCWMGAACVGQPPASPDVLRSGGVCPSLTSGLRDVIYADLIGVGLIGSSSSHMCWERARESIKGSLHITGIFPISSLLPLPLPYNLGSRDTPA